MISTKELILEKTAELFAQHGFAGTSISMIAKEVGVAKSAFYAHFESKNEIMNIIVERYGPPSVIQYLQQFDAKDVAADPINNFTEIMNEVIQRFTTKNSRLFIDLIRMGSICIDGHKGQCSLRKIIENTKEAGGAFIKALQDLEILKKEYPPKFLTWELMAPIIHARLMYFTSQSSDKDIKEGVTLCKKHIQYFVRHNFER